MNQGATPARLKYWASMKGKSHGHKTNNGMHFKHTEETKKHLREVALIDGRKPDFTGHKHKEETKNKLRLINLGKTGYWLGKKRPEMPPSWRAKQSANTQAKLLAGIHPFQTHIRRGEQCYNYRGGIKFTIERGKPLHRLLTMHYRARKKGAKGTHTLKEWNDLKRYYGYMCLCCKKVEPEIRLTEDHIIPLIKGGGNSIDNIQPLCLSCNSRKHVKSTDYRYPQGQELVLMV